METETGAGEAKGRPAGMPWITPYLTVKEVVASVDFYESAFGFTRRSVKDGPDGLPVHAEMTWNGAVLMLGAEGAYGSPNRSPATLGVPSPVGIYVYCEDVDALFERATGAGAKVHFAPADMFWGDRACALIDPDGHAWNFATNKGAEVAEPAAARSVDGEGSGD